MGLKEVGVMVVAIVMMLLSSTLFVLPSWGMAILGLAVLASGYYAFKHSGGLKVFIPKKPYLTWARTAGLIIATFATALVVVSQLIFNTVLPVITSGNVFILAAIVFGIALVEVSRS